MAPRSRQQNEAQREETRHKILQAALQAFAEKGYSAASMSYIARQAGVSKGLSYHYFSGKEDILKGIFDLMIEFADQLHEGWEGLSAREKLSLLIERNFEFIEKQYQIMRFMISLSLQPEVIASLEPYLDEQREKLLPVYSQIFSDLNYPEPEAEAYYLSALIDGFALGFIAMGKNYPLHTLKEKLINKYQL